MSNPSLSEGALLTICRGGTVEKPTLQVLQNNFLAGSGSTDDRYRLFVSDGQYSNSFPMLLATRMNHLLLEGKLEAFTIFRVNNHILNEFNGKKVMILCEIEVLKPGSEVGRKIGDPLQIGADGTVRAVVAVDALGRVRLGLVDGDVALHELRQQRRHKELARVDARPLGVPVQERENGHTDKSDPGEVHSRSLAVSGNPAAKATNAGAQSRPDGDDSVIEVEVVPNTKEVAEIDLTNSPMPPKITTKTVVAKIKDQ